MKKRLLVFGGCGFVGGTVAKLSRAGFETALVGRTNKSGFEEFKFHQADMTDFDEVRRIFETFRPDAVVNAAAMSDIDKSELDQELARRINVEGPRQAARACAARGCKYLFLSSDAVFDGKGKDYTEESAPGPVNYYGRTKQEAEKAVIAENPDSIVFRISLVLGFPVNGGNSFLANLDESLKNGKEIACPVDEVRTPVDVLTLAESILEAIEGNFKGMLHIASTQSLDRYALARRAAALLGYDGSLIKAKQPSPPAPGKAPRHKNGILSSRKAQSLLKTRMLSADETLRRAVDSKNYFERTKR